YPGFSSHMRWHPESGAAVVGFENATYSRVGILVRRLLDGVLADQGRAERVAAPGQAPAAGPDPAVGQARAAGPDPAPAPDPAPDWPRWPELQAARTVVERLARDWDDTLARSILADNVELDSSLDERRRQLAAALEETGPVRPKRGSDGESPTPAQLEWTMPGTRGVLSCAVMLTPLNTPRVQSLTFTAVGP
ncbi:MAG TPA: hypothetical protein VIG41_12725, partial [Micrococcaceae bacterium]